MTYCSTYNGLPPYSNTEKTMLASMTSRTAHLCSDGLNLGLNLIFSQWCLIRRQYLQIVRRLHESLDLLRINCRFNHTLYLPRVDMLVSFNQRHLHVAAAKFGLRCVVPATCLYELEKQL
jgi:hypothetical protein